VALPAVIHIFPRGVYYCWSVKSSNWQKYWLLAEFNLGWVTQARQSRICPFRFRLNPNRNLFSAISQFKFRVSISAMQIDRRSYWSPNSICISQTKFVICQRALECVGGQTAPFQYWVVDTFFLPGTSQLAEPFKINRPMSPGILWWISVGFCLCDFVLIPF